MATPLASLVLSLAAVAGALQTPADQPLPDGAAVCDVAVLDPSTKSLRPTAADSPECRAVMGLQAPFKKLRDRAGFDERSLRLLIVADQSRNAIFTRYAPPPSPGFVGLYIGFLQDTTSSHTGKVMILAHEIGHAVQDQRPEQAERLRRWAQMFKRNPGATSLATLPEDERQEWLAFNRRYEAQADGIAQQLLAESGYPVVTGRAGAENYFGCTNPAVASTHPAPRQRVVNAAFGQELIARHALENAENVRFDGAGVRRGLGGPIRAARPGPQTFTPLAQLSDYDTQGMLLPGRLASSDLRVRVPPRDAGPVREFAQRVAASAVDFWIADPFYEAVNKVAQRGRVTAAVLAACGTPLAEELSRDLTTWGWTKRIAENGALRATAWLRVSLKKDPPPAPAHK